MSQPIYLDNNACTSVAKDVLALVTTHLQKGYKNPSSLHAFGREARRELIAARDTIASAFNVSVREVIFTSGGTESINLAIHAILGERDHGHIITSDVEHPAVYQTLKGLEKRGFEVTALPAGLYGAVKSEAIEKALRKETCLLVFAAVNGETGVKTDIEAIGEIAYHAKVPFVVDAVAALGKMVITFSRGLTAMAFSGQKCHALPGSGLLLFRSSQPFTPLLRGGEQEGGRRAGTENLPAIVSLAAAISLLKEGLPSFIYEMERLRNRLEEGLKASLPIHINGEGPRICNTSNISFDGVDGESLLIALDLRSLAVSHGTACQTGSLKPSRTLINMGLDLSRVKSSIRFSLSRFTSEEEIDRAIEICQEAVKALKKGHV